MLRQICVLYFVINGIVSCKSIELIGNRTESRMSSTPVREKEKKGFEFRTHTSYENGYTLETISALGQSIDKLYFNLNHAPQSSTYNLGKLLRSRKLLLSSSLYRDGEASRINISRSRAVGNEKAPLKAEFYRWNEIDRKRVGIVYKFQKDMITFTPTDKFIPVFWVTKGHYSTSRLGNNEGKTENDDDLFVNRYNSFNKLEHAEVKNDTLGGLIDKITNLLIKLETVNNGFEDDQWRKMLNVVRLDSSSEALSEAQKWSLSFDLKKSKLYKKISSMEAGEEY